MTTKKESSRPHPSSWMDLILNAVERFPLPPVLFYLTLFGLSLLLHTGLSRLDGSLGAGEWPLSIVPTLIWVYAYTAGLQITRRYAREVLQELRPVLELSAQEYQGLESEFAEISPRSAWIITGITVAALIPSFGWMQTFMGRLLFSPYGRYLTILELLLTSSLSVAFLFMVFRDLRLIPRIYERVRKINLFNLSPLYALSGFSSRVGLVFIVFLLLSILTSAPIFGATTGELYNFGGPGNIYFIFYMSLFSVTALLVFILPLLGLHRRLIREKSRIREENNSRVDAAFWELQKRMDSGNLSGIGDLRNGISALMEYRREIQSVSTWPWESGTLRGFLSALFLPIALKLLQGFLSQFIAF